MTDDEPDLQLAGLKVWVDLDNAVGPREWVSLSAECSAAGAMVRVRGSIALVSDFSTLARACDALATGNVEEAAFAPLEPELSFRLRWMDRVGHVELVVDITPDHLHQTHRFSFEIDQTYLAPLARECDRIVKLLCSGKLVAEAAAHRERSNANPSVFHQRHIGRVL